MFYIFKARIQPDFLNLMQSKKEQKFFCFFFYLWLSITIIIISRNNFFYFQSQVFEKKNKAETLKFMSMSLLT